MPVRHVKIVTVHSVHSNIAKIHSRLPAAMEFWLDVSDLWHIHAKTPADSGV